MLPSTVSAVHELIVGVFVVVVVIAFALVHAGTLYAMLMSTLNIGGVVSDHLGGLLTWAIGVTANDFSKLWILVLVRTKTSTAYLLLCAVLCC